MQSQQLLEPLKKSLSYNDLKRKRMGKSLNNNKKNIYINAEQKQIGMQNRFMLTSMNNKRHRRLQAISSRTKDQEIDKQNRRYLNILQILDNFPKKNKLKDDEQLKQNQYVPQQKKEKNYKKTKSMRIITKKSGKNFIPDKESSHILNRIEGIKSFKPAYICNQSILKKYNTASNQQLNNQSQMNQNQRQKEQKKQSIFFNAISPIHKKDQLLDTQKRDQTSGFSILQDIHQKVGISSFQIEEKNLTQKIKFFKNQATDTHHLSQVEVKMPKIVKKGLPRDFFLRV